MKHRLILIGLTFSLMFFFSCDPMYEGFKIVNNTNDSLYYYVHAYKDYKYSYNIAYIPLMQSSDKYKIDYLNNEHKILPNDTSEFGPLPRSRESFAKQWGGITIRFYKREVIEKLNWNTPLNESHVYKRIDIKQDELEKQNYLIQLNK